MTGQSTTLIGGPTFDAGPYFSNDGRRFVFDRKPSATATDAEARLFVADADGSNVGELFHGRDCRLVRLVGDQ